MEEREFTIRERVAGYRELNRLDAEARARMELSERVKEFLSLVRVAEFWKQPSRDESQAWERWARIRRAYAPDTQ